MSRMLKYLSASALGFLLLAVLPGCIVPVGGYSGDVDVGYGVGYSEPYGYQYGGWSLGYRVGPPRGDDRRPDHPPSHSYRSASSSHAVPSIPRHPPHT